MLDPYQRLNLKPLGPVSAISNSTELDTYAYFVNFTVPDHHGMFTFELTTRDLLSYLVDKRVVTVRHLQTMNSKDHGIFQIPGYTLLVPCL